MSRRIVRTAKFLPALVFLLPACVVRLSDRNAPLENGGVSGAAADCSAVSPLGEGSASTDPKDARTKFLGRYDLRNPTRPHFDWSGSSMNARFRGTEVTWGVDNAGVEIVLEQIVDGKSQQVILGGAVKNKTVTVTVPDGEHEITVVRSSEALFSDTDYIPFTFGAGTQQLPPVEHPRRIEYIGDSITCGYGDEGPFATCPYDVPVRTETDEQGKVNVVKIPETQNIYLAYGSLAARRLSADATTLCFSGKGVVLNYREQGVGEGKLLNVEDDADPDARTTIPDYYLRTVATIGPMVTCKLTKPTAQQRIDGRGPSKDCASNDCDQGLCRCAGAADCCAAADADCVKASKCVAPPAKAAGAGGNTCKSDAYQEWDFAKEQQPQVVVINIGTNDFARDADQNSIADGIDLTGFRAGYRKFVGFVRSKRPDAHVFLAVPPMLTDKFPLDNSRSDLRNTLNSIVDEMNGAGDKKVYFIELVEQGVRYGLGCDYHPNLVVHRIMADQVVGAIRSKTCWSTVDAQ